jgi:hypothetical protein
MDNCVGAGHQRDMAAPKHQVTTPQVRRLDRLAQPRLLVAVARAGPAGGIERLLH